MNIEKVTNLVFSSEDRSMIDCILKLYGHDAVPFTASSNDVEKNGVILHNKILNGMYGSIAPYVPPPPIGSKIVQAPPDVIA